MAGVKECTGFQAVAVLRANYAARARAHAAVLAATWDVVTSVAPGSDFRSHGPDEFATDEVRAALGLTRQAARLLVEQAATVVHRLPGLLAAMAAGEVDEPRARIFAELTHDLSDCHALAIVEQLLPLCALSAPTRLTTGKLAERIKALAIALDPDWAQRRYEGSLARQRVVGARQEEGTGSLSGTHLPLERVAASVAHIRALATRAKAAGDDRPVEFIRAELFCGMTDGSYLGLSEAEILAAVAAGRVHPGKSSTGSVRAGVHVKVRLTTLLGLDRSPGELAGWGPITDTHARELVTDLGAAQWRWTLVNDAGQLIRTGLTLARPAGSARRDAACKAVVEIVASAAELQQLQPPEQWRRVVEDLHRRVTTPARPAQDHPRRRFPGPRLRREVTTAIPRCVGVGCRAPASTAQIDHVRDYAHGGVTLELNLDPACAADHRLKTAGGWTLRRLDDHTGTVFVWTTRLGHTYLEPVEPVLPTAPPEGHAEPDDPDPPPF